MRGASRPRPAGSIRRYMLPAGVLLLLLWTVVFPNIAIVASSFEHGLGYWKEFVASPSDMEALTPVSPR